MLGKIHFGFAFLFCVMIISILSYTFWLDFDILLLNLGMFLCDQYLVVLATF